MLDIKQIALEVAKELLDEPLNIGQAEHYTDFATRFLAAIAEKAEPVASVNTEALAFLKRNDDWIRARLPSNEATDTNLFTHPAIEPAHKAAFDQEIKDADELLRLLNLPPDRYRTECGFLNIPKVKAAVREPWDYPTIEPVNPPALSAVGAAPLPDAQLCQFYDVDNFPDLVSAMDHHIEKLQSKLPPTPSLWPGRVREG